MLSRMASYNALLGLHYRTMMHHPYTLMSITSQIEFWQDIFYMLLLLSHPPNCLVCFVLRRCFCAILIFDFTSYLTLMNAKQSNNPNC